MIRKLQILTVTVATATFFAFAATAQSSRSEPQPTNSLNLAETASTIFAETCLATFPSWEGIDEIFEKLTMKKTRERMWNSMGNLVNGGLSEDGLMCLVSVVDAPIEDVISATAKRLECRFPDAWEMGTKSGIQSARILFGDYTFFVTFSTREMRDFPDPVTLILLSQDPGAN